MAELETVLTRRREEVEAKGASYTKEDRHGRADAVWYQRTEGQFSPRSSERPIARLASNSPFGFRESSEPPPEGRLPPHLVRRRSTDATMARDLREPERVRRSFPRRTSTGTALKAPVRPMNSRNASPARSLSATPSSVDNAQVTPKDQPQEPVPSKRAESSSSASTISCEEVAAPKRAPKSPPRAAAKSRNRASGETVPRGGPKASSGQPKPRAKPELRRPGAPKAAPVLPGTESRGGASTSQPGAESQASGSTKPKSGDEQEGASSPVTPPSPLLETIKRRHVKLSTIESVADVQGDDDTPPPAPLPGLPDASEASQGEEESPIETVGHVTTCFSSWRQLSLGSMSSGGLPTILTHLSESKKGMENEENQQGDEPKATNLSVSEASETAETSPSPCAEPEPAPSPEAKPVLNGSPEGEQVPVSVRPDVRPALVINIPPGDNNAECPEANPTCATSTSVKLDEREYRLLWESVVQGDIPKLQEFINRGRLQSGRLQDMNGHSIFWNALAYQQQQVAMFLLHHFPPGSPQGIDLNEVHARRKDTLLHLCVYFQYFSAPVAELFELLFLGMGPVGSSEVQAYWNRENADLDTFLHCAAARRNFWVMRYVASMSHAGEMLFRQNGKSNAMQVLLEKMQEVGVSCPTDLERPEMEVKLPSWMNFSRYLPADAERLPFADVELEVQQQSGTLRVPAHRCVLGAASGVLHQELLESPPGRPLLIDPLSCRSCKVLDTVLTFIYSSRISCDYTEDGCLLWQLLCLCARYQLPEPLWRYARCSLLLAVKNAVFTAMAVIPLLLEAKHEVGLSESEACFAAHRYLEAGTESSKCGEAVCLALAEIELQAMSVLAK